MSGKKTLATRRSRTATRREFLGSTAAGTALLTFGAAAPQVLCQAAASSPQKERILVVVELAGGNDGLNSIIPHSDPAYQKAREDRHQEARCSGRR